MHLPISLKNLCLQSVLGKVNEIAKHKASVEDADTQSKVRKTSFPIYLHFPASLCSLSHPGGNESTESSGPCLYKPVPTEKVRVVLYSVPT